MDGQAAGFRTLSQEVGDRRHKTEGGAARTQSIRISARSERRLSRSLVECGGDAGRVFRYRLLFGVQLPRRGLQRGPRAPPLSRHTSLVHKKAGGADNRTARSCRAWRDIGEETGAGKGTGAIALYSPK